MSDRKIIEGVLLVLTAILTAAKIIFEVADSEDSGCAAALKREKELPMWEAPFPFYFAQI